VTEFAIAVHIATGAKRPLNGIKQSWCLYNTMHYENQSIQGVASDNLTRYLGQKADG